MLHIRQLTKGSWHHILVARAPTKAPAVNAEPADPMPDAATAQEPLHDAVIVGGGIGGLAAAVALAARGIVAPVLEARGRAGGRILSFEAGGQAFDLGPSWIWPGQPAVARLLAEAGLAVFPQYAEGALVHQQADGQTARYPGFAPMGNALRIAGGPGALVAALARKLAPGQLRLHHAVTAVTRSGDTLRLSLTGPEGESEVTARRVALAVPPRLAAALSFTPALPAETARFLDAIPTWMAGHAKFVAVYAEPFWRQQGLSGDVISRRGPLAEIHDISPPQGGPYALFGFLGLDAAGRAALGQDGVIAAARRQLVEVFGAPADTPLALHLKDWSDDPFTAAPADAAPPAERPAAHPAYGMPDLPLGPWSGRLAFIATETDRENGGLIEGAIARAQTFAEAFAPARP